MHRIFSGRIGKPSPQRDSPSFLASLVAVTSTSTSTSTTAIAKDNDETGTTSEDKGGQEQGQGRDRDGASSGTGTTTVATPRPYYTNQLISFYTDPNGGRDSCGRTLSEILRFSNHQLEHHHDYIQWLFPLPEPSPYNWGAPKIDRATAHAFRTRVELRERLRESLVRMVAFYGFEVVLATVAAGGTQLSICEGSDFQRKSAFWIRSFDHNHLRITRIIRCLRVLGLEGEAKAFYKALVRAAAPRPGRSRGVNPRTLMFWRRAAKRPLQVPPEDEGYPEAEEAEAEEEEEEEEEEEVDDEAEYDDEMKYGSGSNGNELEDDDGGEEVKPDVKCKDKRPRDGKSF